MKYSLEEISIMFCDLIMHIPENELRKWKEKDFEKFIKSIKR